MAAKKRFFTLFLLLLVFLLMISMVSADFNESAVLSCYDFNADFNDSLGVNNLTVSNAVLNTTDGFIGNSSTLTSGYVVSSSSISSLSYPFSYSFWIKPYSLSGNNGFGEFRDLSDARFNVYHTSGNSYLRVGGSFYIANTSFSSGAWQLVTVVVNSTDAYLYKNTDLIRSQSHSLSLGGNRYLLVGAVDYGLYNDKITGDIDEVFVYNDFLSASDISYVYNSGSGLSCSILTDDSVANADPSANIFYPLNGSSFTDQTWINISVLGVDDDNSSLSGSLFVNDLLNITNSSLVNDSSWYFNLSSLSYGNYNLTFQVSDGINIVNSSVVYFNLSETVSSSVYAPVINLSFDNSSACGYNSVGVDYTDNSLGCDSYSVCKWYGCVNLSSTAGTDYLSGVNDFDLNSNITVSFWMNPTTEPSGSNGMGYWKMGSGDGYKYTLEGDYGLAHYINFDNGSLSAPTAESYGSGSGVWTHQCMQYDGSNLYVYKNGVLVKTTAADYGSINYSSGEVIEIGRSNFNIDIEGYMDEFLVYNNTVVSCGDLYDSVEAGTPPNIDLYVSSISYNLPFNWSDEYNGLELTVMPINFTIKNEGSLNDSGMFNISFELNNSILQTWRINLSAGEERVLEYNWSPSFGFFSGWLSVDVLGEVVEDVEDNNVQRVFIPFLDRPYMLFDRADWVENIEPYSSNSSNVIAFDSYEWTKIFSSDAWNDGWSGNDVDPRGKKARENANNCFLNNYSGGACNNARNHLFGWANRTVSGYNNVQSIHELIHVGFAYDLMFSNLTESENDLIVDGFHDICQYIFNINGVRPDLDDADFVVTMNNTEDINYFLNNYSKMGDMERVAYLHNNFNVPIDILLDMNSLVSNEVSE